MSFVVLMVMLLVWPLSGVAGQRLAQERRRDPEFWLFACALGGPPAYLLLQVLPARTDKPPRRRLADRIVAIVAVLLLLLLMSSTMLRACLGWG
ncbi:MAG: hypothetical protein ABIJ09_23025 [Pseudomonadota bacterium]